MTPLVSTDPTLLDTLKASAQRLAEWWRRPVPQRGAHVQHSGGWGQHAGTVSRW